jgi:hypothetical protein
VSGHDAGGCPVCCYRPRLPRQRDGRAGSLGAALELALERQRLENCRRIARVAAAGRRLNRVP